MASFSQFQSRLSPYLDWNPNPTYLPICAHIMCNTYSRVCLGPFAVSHPSHPSQHMFAVPHPASLTSQRDY